MTGNPRRLTADGRVCSATHVILDPAKGDPVAIRLFGSWGVDCGSLNLIHDPVKCEVCLPSEAWFEGAANTWDATCKTCRGDGLDPRNLVSHTGCPTCGGTGVDETIPAHLVGIGSVLRDARDGTDHVVIARAENRITTRSIEDGRLWTRHVSQVGPGKPWPLVRPVPIIHTTAKDTP
jgi:hypothetical protein